MKNGYDMISEAMMANRKIRTAESALTPATQREATSSGDMVEAPLNAKRRNALPASAFAGPDRTYPIDTPARARAALSRVEQFGNSALKARVRAAVKRRYPDMDVS